MVRPNQQPRFHQTPTKLTTLFRKKSAPGYKPLVAVLRRQLIIVTCYLDIWIMKEYGVQESWVKVFRCPHSQWINLYNTLPITGWHPGLSVTCSDDGSKIVMMLRKTNKFICCNIESQEATIEETGLPHHFSAIFPWVDY